jgi:hypothetical protein
VLLGSHAQPLKAMTMTGSNFASWLEEGNDEVCDFVDPVPQLLLSLPKLDWFQLLTITELHLLRDPLNPNGQFINLEEVSRWIYRERPSKEGLLILAHYDPLGREYPPTFENSFFRNKEIENEWRKFFWPKRHPAPWAVYPTPIMSELMGKWNPLSFKMTNHFWQTEDTPASTR